MTSLICTISNITIHKLDIVFFETSCKQSKKEYHLNVGDLFQFEYYNYCEFYISVKKINVENINELIIFKTKLSKYISFLEDYSKKELFLQDYENFNRIDSIENPNFEIKKIFFADKEINITDNCIINIPYNNIDIDNNRNKDVNYNFSVDQISNEKVSIFNTIDENLVANKLKNNYFQIENEELVNEYSYNEKRKDINIDFSECHKNVYNNKFIQEDIKKTTKNNNQKDLIVNTEIKNIINNLECINNYNSFWKEDGNHNNNKLELKISKLKSNEEQEINNIQNYESISKNNLFTSDIKNRSFNVDLKIKNSLRNGLKENNSFFDNRFNLSNNLKIKKNDYSSIKKTKYSNTPDNDCKEIFLNKKDEKFLIREKTIISEVLDNSYYIGNNIINKENNYFFTLEEDINLDFKEELKNRNDFIYSNFKTDYLDKNNLISKENQEQENKYYPYYLTSIYCMREEKNYFDKNHKNYKINDSYNDINYINNNKLSMIDSVYPITENYENDLYKNNIKQFINDNIFGKSLKDNFNEQSEKIYFNSDINFFPNLTTLGNSYLNNNIKYANYNDFNNVNDIKEDNKENGDEFYLIHDEINESDLKLYSINSNNSNSVNCNNTNHENFYKESYYSKDTYKGKKDELLSNCNKIFNSKEYNKKNQLEAIYMDFDNDSNDIANDAIENEIINKLTNFQN